MIKFKIAVIFFVVWEEGVVREWNRDAYISNMNRGIGNVFELGYGFIYGYFIMF